MDPRQTNVTADRTSSTSRRRFSKQQHTTTHIHVLPHRFRPTHSRLSCPNHDNTDPTVREQEKGNGGMSEHIHRHEADQGSRIMTGSAAPHMNLQKGPPLRATDEGAQIPVKEGRRGSRSPSRERKLDRRSPEYIWKSGLAGGLAGCAVRIYLHTCILGLRGLHDVSMSQRKIPANKFVAGQNSRRTPRPRENPPSNAQPCFLKIRWPLVGFTPCFARHLC